MAARSASRFAWRMALGVVTLLLLNVLVAAASVAVQRRSARQSEEETARYSDDLVLVERLRFNAEEQIAASRGYVLSGNRQSLERLRIARTTFAETLGILRAHARTKTGEALVADVGTVDARYEHALDEEIAARTDENGGTLDTHIRPAQDDLRARIQVFVDYKRAALTRVIEAARRDAERALDLLLVVALAACGLGAGLGFVLARHLTSLYQAEQKAVQQREDVLAIVSHDLRNPLASIALAARVLARGPPAARTAELAQSIARSSAKMERLIRDLLDAAKLTAAAGAFPIHKTSVDVARLWADVAESFTAAAAEKGVALTVESPVGLVVYGDADRLAQALGNLVANALKHVPPGGHVRVAAGDAGDAVELSVTNDGPGIPADVAAHVFDRFWSKSEGGTGLGLFIARGIVETHGGTIRLDRDADRTTFALRIPHRPPSDDA